MLDYFSVVAELKQKFPEFKFDSFHDDSPIMVFSLFAEFVHTHILKKDEIIVNRCVEYINEIAAADAIELLPLLDEFGYELIALSIESYNGFLKRLNSVAVEKIKQ